MEKKLTVHRGAVLQAVARRNEKPIVKIAEAAGYDPTSYYVHIKKPDLSFDILYKYSKALNYDFSMEIPDMDDYLTINGLRKGTKKLTYDELEDAYNTLRDKYYSLMDKYNDMIEQKFKGNG